MKESMFGDLWMLSKLMKMSIESSLGILILKMNNGNLISVI